MNFFGCSILISSISLWREKNINDKEKGNKDSMIVEQREKWKYESGIQRRNNNLKLTG